MEEIAINIIKEELVKRDITVLRIILFGSRARGDYKNDSDWDILVVVDKEPTFNEIKKIIGAIQWRLAEYKIPNDLIIRSEKHFLRAKKCVGNISHYAENEGIALHE